MLKDKRSIGFKKNINKNVDFYLNMTTYKNINDLHKIWNEDW